MSAAIGPVQREKYLPLGAARTEFVLFPLCHPLPSSVQLPSHNPLFVPRSATPGHPRCTLPYRFSSHEVYIRGYHVTQPRRSRPIVPLPCNGTLADRGTLLAPSACPPLPAMNPPPPTLDHPLFRSHSTLTQHPSDRPEEPQLVSLH